MPKDKPMIRELQKNQPPLMRRFVIFSAVLLVAILAVGSIVFMFSMRQIISINKGNEMSQNLEIKSVKLEASVESEISLALTIAKSPLIISFFANPDDPEQKRIALRELAAYKRAFEANTIFWVNDADMLFYFNDDAPFLLDPAIPDNYWYYMTLFETEDYNFNINYNPDLNVTNLWINVPVFADDGEPLGIIGTGIDLSTFLNTIYKDHAKNVDIYFFNNAGEITGADDVDIVAAKKSIDQELDFVGTAIVPVAKTLKPGETITLDFALGKIAISSIPLLEWYSIAVFHYSVYDYNSAMTVFFILSIIVLALVLIIFNIFISKLLKPMRISMEEAEAANKAKSAFLSTMSHEMRTPLNAILGITEIQLQKGSLDQSIRDGLEKVFASGDMLLGIINDILDLSKIEAGKLELIIDRYEIASLVSDTAQLNMMRIGSKPIAFELFVDERIPAFLLGDELRIKQILNNLLSNAFKYTTSGTVKLSFSAEQTEGKDNEATLIIGISDTGQGMTPEQVSKLFDEYARFNMQANRSTEGTGLGMSITNNLIHLMNGEIQIESAPGKGSTFTVRIPQEKINADVLGRKSAENLHKFRTSNMSSMKWVKIVREPMPYGNILIVDDVETNIYVAKGLMSDYELNMDSAESGFETIEKIKNGNVYDIIFMDHMMPQMDGIETTNRIRGMGYEHPIVALTANAVAGQSEIFLSSGFDEFLSKPIDIRQLNAVLNKLIRDKQPPEVIEEARARAKAKEGQRISDGERSGVDRRFAEIFLRDAHRSAAVLEAFIEKAGPYSEEEIRTYVIHAHGMKSALANIGRADISAVALKLEKLGRENDIESVAVETPAFLNSLKALIEELTPAEDNDGEETIDEDNQYLSEMLLNIRTACEEYDNSTAADMLEELKKTVWPRRTKALLGKIDEKLLHSDFDEIADDISEFLNIGKPV